jgi:hypothetical protein
VRVRNWDSSIDVDVTDHYNVDYTLVLNCADAAVVCYADPAFRTQVEFDAVLISLEPISTILQELYL